MKNIKSIIMMIVGTILATPFFLNVFILDNAYRFAGFDLFLFISVFIFGACILMIGFINLIVGNSNSRNSNTSEIDLSRIRYTSETELFKNKDK